ncbi:MAG: UMP kinase [Candidatus Diapherotrites archaeon]
MYNEGMNEASPAKDSGSTGTIESVSFGAKQKIFVLSVGGSIIAPDKPDAAFVSKFGACLERLFLEGYRFALVAGGGQTARNYIAAVKALGADNFALDEIGIAATRLNAALLIHGIERAHPEVLTDIRKAREIIVAGKIPVFGGLMPGFTTDAVAVLLAESLSMEYDVEYVNMTNVSGIYSSDPSVHPKARMFERISFERLLSLMKLAESKPGQNLVIDVPACLFLKRSKIPGIVLDGRDLDNLEKAIKGMEFEGTRILEMED